MTGAATGLAGSWTVIALACLAAGNPARRAAALVGEPRPAWPAVGVAAVLTLALVGLLTATAGPLLDALDVSAPTARVAAGLVLAVVALAQLVAPAPAGLPGADDRGAALVPLAFPQLLRPELVLVALSAGADHGGSAVALVAVPLVLTPAALAAGPSHRRLLEAVGRLLAGLGVLAGVDLVVDGVIAL